MVIIYHFEEPGLDDVKVSVCIWCEVSVSSSLCSQAWESCAGPLWEASEIMEILKGGWVTDRLSAKNIKRGVARAAAARSALELEHSQGMNPSSTTDGKTAQSSGERWANKLIPARKGENGHGNDILNILSTT